MPESLLTKLNMHHVDVNSLCSFIDANVDAFDAANLLNPDKTSQLKLELIGSIMRTLSFKLKYQLDSSAPGVLRSDCFMTTSLLDDLSNEAIDPNYLWIFLDANLASCLAVNNLNSGVTNLNNQVLKSMEWLHNILDSQLIITGQKRTYGYRM